MFHTYIQTAGEQHQRPNLKILLKSISYQFSMETKRVYLQELKDIMRKKAPQHFRGKIENSHGILKNLTEQSIVQLAQFFKPEIQGKNIFDSFTTRLCQSMKLREDIFVLHRFLILLEDKGRLLRKRHLMSLNQRKTLCAIFESFTFKLLRYDDYDEFASFFNEYLSFKDSDYNKIT